MQPVRWGVLGASGFARSYFVPAMMRAPHVEVLGVAARDHGRAEEFRAAFGLPQAYAGYQALLADPAIEAVYIPLANGAHYEWAMRAAEAGKHAIVEKPLTLNARQAEELVAAFRGRNLHLAEAFMYRYAPRTLKLKELAGTIGPIRRIHAAFHILQPDQTNVRFDPEQGGGALYDVGCYAINISRYIAGAEPEQVAARLYHRQGAQVDDEGEVILDFPGGLVAIAEFSFNSTWHERVDVAGEHGHLAMDGCFTGRGVKHVIQVSRTGQAIDAPERQTVECDQVDALEPYVCMLEQFAQVVRGQAAPLVPGEDAIGNLRVIDAIFRSAAAGGAPVSL